MKQILLLGMTLLSLGLYAQGVTTSSMQGLVEDDMETPLPGAHVVATHTPSGTTYQTSTNFDGKFFFPNLRVGGPYRVVVSFIGFDEQVYSDIMLGLGQSFNLKVEMKSGQTLDEIIISSRRGITDPSKTGASTNLSRKKIDALPTINRSIDDFTRLTPQSNGTSFAGTSSRFNNYTIDGNIYNNNFGLGSSQFAGGNPVSLDAIEEVQVNLAPFDVRTAGFTGASVNAVTKSGNNTFTGSAYYFLRNDQMTGDLVGDTRLNKDDARNEIKGVTLGGPIIKDKLFFFVSYEEEEELVPSFNKRALRPGETPDNIFISRVPASLLQDVRSNMLSLYDYETGDFEGYSFGSEQTRFNARLDWNINTNHKFMVRYNHFTSFNDVPTNGNSIRFINTRYRNTSRTGIEAMNFRNTNYTNDREVISLVGELTSVLGDNMSNQLNVGYTSIADPTRGIPGGQTFPFIEVLEPGPAGDPLYYFSLGNELYSVGNLLENRIFNITNDLSYFYKDHKFTAGVNFERMTFDNAFNPAFNGFYRFNTYQAFEDAVINRVPGALPDAFATSYALDGSTTPPTDETIFSQLSFYLQDEWQVTSDLKLTAGLRMDLPHYNTPIPRNQLLDNVIDARRDPNSEDFIAENWGFQDNDGNTFTPDVSQFPKVNPLLSPRVGFNWDVNGKGTTQLRGGTGIFSGRLPFVWLSNQVNGSGVVRGGLGFEGEELANSDLFGPDYQFNPDVTFGNPENPEQTLSNELNLTDRDFKLPQVWRSNLALDQQLPLGIVGTLELMYSQDITTPIAYNSVLRDPDGTLNGPDQRPFWEGSYSNDPDFRNVFLLTNANRKADYYSITTQFSKNFNNGLSSFVAYTHSRSRDLDAAGGSQAISLWASTVKEDRNNPELSYSAFDIPHRVIGNLAYSTENTTISVFYQGSNAGRFSYTYSGNFGDASDRLIYIPNNASELNFQEYTSMGRTITAQEQATALDAYIDQDTYLSENRGEIAERNGALRPWLHRLDLRLTQDIALTNDKKNKLQFSLDFLNFGNLLNSDWGVPQFANQSNLLNYRGRNEQGEPIYRLNTISGTSELPTETFRNTRSIVDTWRLQLGVRYSFN
ncbi:outer membrane beta-barrel protein [Salegentibacter sp. HM20]